MKFSTIGSVSLSVLAASQLVSARPLHRRPKEHCTSENSTVSVSTSSSSSSSSNSSGAAYFITNEPSGNLVLSANIGSDGQLTFGKAVSAGGRGVHGIANPIGPDGLFSQGSIKVAQSANMLAAVNPGANTVALFAIDPENPADISMIGEPVSSEGEFPMSLAFNNNATQLCVLNGGQVNGVNCYSINSTLGLVAQENTLRPLGLNQTTPANGPAGSASDLIFNEDGSQLIASVKGIPPTPGFLAAWNVDPTDGSLSPNFTTIAPASGGLLPFSMTLIGGKNAILATDAGVGFDIFDLSGGNQSSVVPIDGQGATCWSSFSPKTGNFYLTDIITDIMTEVHVDNNLNGTIVRQYPQTNGSGTIDNDIASIGDNDFMYIMSANTTSVQVLALNAPGEAQNIQDFDLAGPAAAAGIDISFNLQGMTTFVKPT